MLPFPDVPFPREAVRNLLGVMRAIFADAKDRGAPAQQLKRIQAVGRKLAEALEMEAEYRSRPGCMGYRAAWKKAEDGALEAGELVDTLDPTSPILAGAGRRIRGR